MYFVTDGSLSYNDLTDKPTIPTKTSDLTNDDGFISGITSSDVTTALGFTPYNSSNPSGYTSNVGTVTSVNNISPVNGNVTLSIPTVDQSYSGTSTNAQSGIAVKSAIDTVLSSVYIPMGSSAFADIPTPTSQYIGNVFNITDAFVTTSDFVEGAGKSYPAGTNIVCIQDGPNTYKWDALAGMVDLSGYVPTSRTVNGQALSSNISLTASDVNAVASNTAITGATKCKITYDSKGLVTAGADLSASDIPDISATYQIKITSSNKISADNISDGTTNKTVTATEKSTWSGKQDALVSGTSIKTINSTSLLGSGDISITGLPSQTSQSGKFLTTNGTSASWANVDALPSQSGNSGKYLTTNGSTASWETINTSPTFTYDSSTETLTIS